MQAEEDMGGAGSGAFGLAACTAGAQRGLGFFTYLCWPVSADVGW